MKKSVIILVLGLFSTGLLMASSIDKGGKDKLERLAEKLELTEQQQAQIKPILEKYRAKKEQIKETYTEKKERHNAMKALRTDMRAEVIPYLTAEQIAKWDEMKEKRKGKKGNRGEGERQGRG